MAWIVDLTTEKGLRLNYFIVRNVKKSVITAMLRINHLSATLFLFFSKCADTKQILEWQVLRARFGFDFDFYQQSDAGIEPGTAG